MKKTTRLLIPAVCAIIFGAASFYITLPALNVYSKDFWIFVTSIAVVYGIVYLLCGLKSGEVKFDSIFSSKKIKEKNKKDQVSEFSVGKLIVIIAIIPVAVLAIGSLISSSIFNASKYATIIEVPDAVFEEDMPEADMVSNIALMDTESATIIGKTTLGQLSNVVSQYEINGTYSQINYHGAPEKISTLEYADIFRWFNNKGNGIPGYVMVDPVNSSAEYVEFSKPIKYTDSAYLNEDLHRKLRMSYPTKIFGSYSFELDEEGNPYYIVSCMSPKVGLFGAMDVTEVIIFDPCSGSSELYSVNETPSWVDNVFTGDLASQKYDWYGTLKNGFWNSVVGKKDCKVTTDDYGYIIIGDDVWFFTGVTSVSNDESNIGFIISNARTGEYKFYSVVGAHEYSAMSAAQGEVQEKGYTASFPSLINVSGEATYIMVLKDSGGLVKLYALVNVENYSIVATGNTQTEAKRAYLELLKQDGQITDPPVELPNVEEKEAAVTVNDIRIVTVDGNSVLYITASDGFLYKQSISNDESVMLIGVGDIINIKYYDTDIGEIKTMIAWSAVTQNTEEE